jgi:hypothetical protein
MRLSEALSARRPPVLPYPSVCWSLEAAAGRHLNSIDPQQLAAFLLGICFDAQLSIFHPWSCSACYVRRPADWFHNERLTLSRLGETGARASVMATIVPRRVCCRSKRTPGRTLTKHGQRAAKREPSSEHVVTEDAVKTAYPWSSAPRPRRGTLPTTTANSSLTENSNGGNARWQ